MKYYKRYNDEFYSFDEAYNAIEKNELKDVVMQVNNEFGRHFQVKVDLDKQQRDNMLIPVWAAKSDKWELWVIDNEKQELAENIGYWIKNDLGVKLDSRFWKDENMSIEDWWRQLEDNILIEEDYLEIMNFIKKSGLLQDWKNRKRKNIQKWEQ